jgi:D-alanyl-D-alanine carboxypeptidase
METRPLLRVTLAVALVSPLGCRARPETAAAPSDPAPRLAALVSAAVGDGSSVRGAAMALDSPELGLIWRGAAGLADPPGEVPMTPATPVRIASNTKTFVAAAVLRMVEERRLGLDDALANRLPEEQVALLRDDGYDPERMLLRHLLTHTAGLFDHTSTSQYEERITGDPLHRWTPLEQLEAAVEWGQPLAGPGEVYSYCDTGYVLLGQVLERATGQPLAAAVRELVGFERLGLTSTWWETLEPAPDGVPPRAHQYLGELDTVDFDPSFDLYGGGGLVSTVEDLARFMRALMTGGVFARPETLDLMLAPVEGTRARSDAGPGELPPGADRMGVWSVGVAGLPSWRHSGFWGTLATYVPDLDLTVALTVNQNGGRAAMERLAAGAVELAQESAELATGDAGPLH